MRHLVDSVAHHTVHVPYQALALTFHARKMQQEKHIMELGDKSRKQLLRFGKMFCNLLKMRHFSQSIPSLSGFQIGIQFVEIRLADFINYHLFLIFRKYVGVVRHPFFNLRSRLPITVIFLQHHVQNMACRSVESLIFRNAVKITLSMLGSKNIAVFITFKFIV